MTNHRMTFPGGWWADIRTVWPYGADTRMAAAWMFTEGADDFEQACRVTLQESVVAAHLPDVNGDVVEFGPEMWETVEGRVGRRVLRECRKRWAEYAKDADPNDTSEP